MRPHRTENAGRRGECCLACLACLVIIIVLICASAENQRKDNGNGNGNSNSNSNSSVGFVGVYTTPVGLSILVDHTGKVTLSCSPGISLPTPIGTFSVRTNVSFPRRRVLVVRAGDQQHFYEIGSEKLTISIPNDKSGLSVIETDREGNVTVTIPDPVWHSPIR